MCGLDCAGPPPGGGNCCGWYMAPAAAAPAALPFFCLARWRSRSQTTTPIKASAATPPTTPPTMGPTGVEGPGVGDGVELLPDGVVGADGVVDEGSFGVVMREMEVVEVSGVVEVDVSVSLGEVYQILPVPAATAQPSTV